VLTTSFPAGIAMASTWDIDLVQKEGQAIAQEVKSSTNVQCMRSTCLLSRPPFRMPMCGR
jgi:hypothetical protein